jgi:hypothetical protein
MPFDITPDVVGISEMQKCGLKYVMFTPPKRVGDFNLNDQKQDKKMAGPSLALPLLLGK